MAFRYALFPECRRYGAIATTQHDVGVVKLRNGVEYRTSRRDGALRRFEFTYGLADQFTELSEAHSFYLNMSGAEDSFLFRDYLDHNTSSSGHGVISATDVPIGTGDAAEVDFQLKKQYVVRDPDSVVVGTKDRTIELPVPSSVVVAIDGTPTSAFTVSKTTGVVTMTAAPALGEVVTAGCEFYVPVRFSDETSAAFEVSFPAQNAGEASIALTEVANEAHYSTDYNFGGYYDGTGFSSDVRLTLGDGRLVEMTPQSSGLRVFLPNVKNLNEGIGLFWFLNQSTTETFDLFPFEGGSSLTTVPVASGGVPGARVLGLKAAGSGKVWVAIG